MVMVREGGTMSETAKVGADTQKEPKKLPYHKKIPGIWRAKRYGRYLGLLWKQLQGLQPDENGIIHFNFDYWKRVHDIAPDATVPE